MYMLPAGILGHDNLSRKAAKCMPVLFFGPGSEISGLLRRRDAISGARRTFMVPSCVLVRRSGALYGLLQIVGQSLNNFRYNPRPSFWPLCHAQLS
jgi:hypothetical protein